METKDGDVYQGEWKFGKQDGFGEYRFASGTVYHGEFKNGMLMKKIKKRILGEGGT
jgi:hypothetical protein